MWIMNPKIFRPAQDLLLSVAVNCCTHSPADIEVIGNFTKLRFKNKPNINLYLVSFHLRYWYRFPSLFAVVMFLRIWKARKPKVTFLELNLLIY